MSSFPFCETCLDSSLSWYDRDGTSTLTEDQVPLRFNGRCTLSYGHVSYRSIEFTEVEGPEDTGGLLMINGVQGTSVSVRHNQTRG